MLTKILLLMELTRPNTFRRVDPIEQSGDLTATQAKQVLGDGRNGLPHLKLLKISDLNQRGRELETLVALSQLAKLGKVLPRRKKFMSSLGQ